MRVTLDSNAWEEIYRPDCVAWRLIRQAIVERRIQGFICDIGFRIEAIPRRDRPVYFAQPAMDVQLPMDIVQHNDRSAIRIMTMGPDDKRHPGLPDQQTVKLQAALADGIRLIRGSAWVGLPVPAAICEPSLFVSKVEAPADREQRQVDANAMIEERGVGKAAFDAVGGWNVVEGKEPSSKAFEKACAEWSDGETIAAHIAYQNDVLCTNDRARGAGVSVFDHANRAWLAEAFGVRFMTLHELEAAIAGDSQL